ncbi:MAG: hypothetical protein IMY72_06565 [Bacteroidetes bacterium]|nr:hypothetical protein [Bacteroidota bacterium]
MKNSQDEKILKKIKNLFKTYEPEYNPADWEKLKSSMNSGNIQTANKSFFEYWQFYAKIFFSIAFIASFLFLIFNFSNKKLNKNLIIKNKTLVNSDNNIINEEENLLFDSLNLKIKNDKIKAIKNKENNVANKKIIITNTIKQKEKNIKNISSNLILSDSLKKYVLNNIYKKIKILVDTNIDNCKAKQFLNDKFIISDTLNDLRETDTVKKIIKKSDKSKFCLKMGIGINNFISFNNKFENPEYNYGIDISLINKLKKELFLENMFSFSKENFSQRELFKISVGDTNLVKNDTLNNGTHNIFNAISDSVVSISAKNTVLSWNIALRYNFYNKNNSGFFISIGLNNKYFIKEKYKIQYQKIIISDLEYKNKFTWLSAISLSSGYEFKTKRNCNIQINPYINIPISNFGSMNKKWINTGISIRLNFINRREK